MGCFTKKPANPLNFISARKGNNVLTTDLGSPVNDCFLALSAPALFLSPIDSENVQGNVKNKVKELNINFQLY